MKPTARRCRQMRPYYNLPSKSEHGRKMTGFMTPYRHFMWKQNELWRNVHEAQFEHLRKMYKRQWLEAFRVNADEYIYKYNITKAAQLAQWENEMHEQEKKRRDNLYLAQARQSLKKKHLDLLREFHERQFFYWYERASERLQYMSYIRYVPQSKIQEHIEAELDKYVIGSKEPYRLNFAGQMPLLEDKDGNIAEVPSNLFVNHIAEHPSSTAKEYNPPEGVTLAEEQLLQLLASAQEEQLVVGGPSHHSVEMKSDGVEGEREDPRASSILDEVINDVLRQEEMKDAEVKVARSMEETEEEREISRRAYIDRGKIGSKAIFRPRSTDSATMPASPGGAGASMDGGIPSGTGGTSMPPPPARRRRKIRKEDKAHAKQLEQDIKAMELQRQLLQGDAIASSASGADGTGVPGVPPVGEIGLSAKRLRDRIVMPSIQEIQAATQTDNVRMQSLLDKKYQRGKFKKGGDTNNTAGGGKNDSNDS